MWEREFPWDTNPTRHPQGYGASPLCGSWGVQQVASVTMSGMGWCPQPKHQLWAALSSAVPSPSCVL